MAKSLAVQKREVVQDVEVQELLGNPMKKWPILKAELEDVEVFGFTKKWMLPF